MAGQTKLIWLDSRINDNNLECQQTLTHLERVVNNVHTFIDADQCIDFLLDASEDRIFMIISDALCQNSVPSIHDVNQVHSIFIFCDDKAFYEEWAKDWHKVKGVFSEIPPICEHLTQLLEENDLHSIPIGFAETNVELTNEKLNQLDPSFMCTKLLKEILLSIPFKQEDLQEFVTYCHTIFVDDNNHLTQIKKFIEEYHEHTPVWWYMSSSFLYSMLNRALRQMDMQVIIKMGFFMCDLHRHIAQLHGQQFCDRTSGESLMVYRGQIVHKRDFDLLMDTKGGLLSFNNFLSTSTDRNIPLLFADSHTAHSDMVGVLFEITVDLSISSVPFASVGDVSSFQETDEILFSMHTVFRIRDIKPIDVDDQLFQVNLVLTNDTDRALQILSDCIREETLPDANGWYRLGELLLKMGQPDKAQQIYLTLLEQVTDDLEKGSIYQQIARSVNKQGEYTAAITWCEKALEIYQKHLPSTHPDLSILYNNFGNTYDNMGEYIKALSYYDEALEMMQSIHPPHHPHLAQCHANIGNIYNNMGDWSKALSSYEKVLEIQPMSLPADHPDVAASYNNIGVVYNNLDDYSKALSFHERALQIRQEKLPRDHPDRAMSYNNIGVVHNNLGDYSKAFSFHEQALEIRQKILSASHPDLASSYHNIGLVYMNMADYPKAFTYLEKALSIQERTFLPNHPMFCMLYNNLGLVYDKIGEHGKALSFYERAVHIGQNSLTSNHPYLQQFQKNLDLAQKNYTYDYF